MYALAFARDAVDEIAAIDSSTERRKIFAAIQCLTANAESPGVAEVIDAEGRINRMAVISSVAFVYWADHVMRTLRILAIRQAGAA